LPACRHCPCPAPRPASSCSTNEIGTVSHKGTHTERSSVQVLIGYP
jgi:hypothetical protein